MTTPIDRRQFLRGDFQARRTVLRPPWAVTEDLFRERCRGCGECIVACRPGILVAGYRELPEIDFAAGECTFCGECANACDIRALDRRTYKTLPWTYHAMIDEVACLSSQGVVCAICRDVCNAGALHLPLRVGSVARPVLNADACTGCGACVAPCPVNAIHIRPLLPADH